MKSFHAQTAEEALDALRVDASGLSSAEAKERKERYGRNMLPSAHPAATRAQVFASQWKNPLILILLAAGAVSGIVGELTDMIIIFATAGINTIVGFLQEDKANQALKKLRTFVTHSSAVLRDGRKQLVPSEDLVPGDILFVSAGDNVQADARLLAASELRVNEAPLTGESLPVKKHADPVPETDAVADRRNMLYRGSAVERGEGSAVVIATGRETELGKIAALVKETREEATPLQEQLGRLARVIGAVILVIGIALFFIGELAAAGRYTALELFQTAVAVSVAAIPEGLVISLTVILAIGMQQILLRRALVRRMLAAETLGSVSVICTDKTGTLTVGNMRVTRILTPAGAKRDEDLALRIGIMANDGVLENPDALEESWKFFGDTTDTALVRAGMARGLEKRHVDAALPRLGELPFTSERKYLASLHAVDHERVLYVKGAPEVLLDCSAFYEDQGEVKPMTKEMRAWFDDTAKSLADEGLRVLLAAYRRTSGAVEALDDALVRDMVAVGFFALSDPIRPDVRETIALCRQAGIRVIMVTGDHRRTAAAIGRELGFPDAEDAIREGRDIAGMDDAALGAAIARASIFARVDPEHKLAIVRVLRAAGEVVAVTGDGVNDAPALKAADIGIAVGSGTDVAKETSDMVLLDDSFSTIVAAVQEGRRLYQNIKKVVLYLLSGSFAEVILIAGSIIGGFPLAVLPAQILWVNIIEDTFPNIALAFDRGEQENMNDPPRKKSEPLLDRHMKTLIGIISIVSNLVLFGLFLFFLRAGFDIARIRTLMFVGLGIDSLLYIYSVRSMRRHVWQMPLFDNPRLTAAVAAGFALLAGAVHLPPLQMLLNTVPLGLGEWGVMLIFGLFNVLIIETAKYFFLANSSKRYASAP